MKIVSSFLRRFLRQTHGQDIIEYALLAGIVTAATVLAIEQIGTKVVGVYGDNVTEIIASGDGGADPGGGGNGGGNANGNANGNGNGGNGNSNGNGNGNGNSP